MTASSSLDHYRLLREDLLGGASFSCPVLKQASTPKWSLTSSASSLKMREWDKPEVAPFTHT
eukprot:CAMPEP_0182459070 /NCGR_PEP_ID=MMETSP1319-20130603/4279_1 /TAXON_ID=172717 /ORGANISM="Bolidomonas pacifica, Strain RCC208" /LENGTH=61 /DNA_ID=CAMNT_0024657901 /DNA_START=87 /DNA_END=272 /DNA_ORIENTATION=+